MGASLSRPLNELEEPLESFSKPSEPLESRYHHFEGRVTRLHHQLTELQQQHHTENGASERDSKRNYTTALNVLPAGAMILYAQAGQGSPHLFGEFSCKALCRAVVRRSFAP